MRGVSQNHFVGSLGWGGHQDGFTDLPVVKPGEKCKQRCTSGVDLGVDLPRCDLALACVRQIVKRFWPAAIWGAGPAILQRNGSRRGPAERFRAKSVKIHLFLMIFEVSQRRGEEVDGTQWITEKRSSREVQSEKC